MNAWIKRLGIGKPGVILSSCIAATIATIAWGRILLTPGFVMHGDITFPTNLTNYILNFLPLWNQHPSYSNLDEIDRLAVMIPVLWISKVLHLDMALYSRLFLFVTFLACSVSIIIGKRKIEDIYFPEASLNPWTRVVGDVFASIIFCFNPWSLYRISAPFFAIAYAMSPLVVAYQLEFLRTRRWQALVIATLAWTIASGSPQYTIFFGVLSLALFFSLGTKGIKQWLAALLNFAIIAAAYGVLNLYWIGPAWKLIHIQDVSPGYTLNWADIQTFSAKATFWNVVSGTDMWVVWWTKDNPFIAGALGTLSTIARTFFFFSALTFAVVYRRKPFMIFAFCAILVLVVMLEGANGPFRSLYHAIVFGLIPAGYGWIIRAPEKFGAFFWLFVSLLTGVGSTLALANATRRQIGLSVVLGSLTILTAWFPIVYGTLLTDYVPVPVPIAYNETEHYFKADPGKVLVLADYEENARWISGDAIFKWAPTKMAGFVVARSLPAPTFGGYHFQNPFSFFYSFIKEAGPERLPTYAALLGTKYVLLEHDIEGDDAWFSRWSAGVEKSGAKLVETTDDFALYKFPNIATAEYRTGSYAVIAGSAASANQLVDRFGASISHRNLIFLDQQLPGSLSTILHSKLLILNDQTLSDVAAITYSRDHYTPLFSAVYNNNMSAAWAHTRLNNSDEENEAGWNKWQKKGLRLPETWPLDLGLGIVSTTVPYARLSIQLNVPKGSGDVYVRFYDFAGKMKPRLLVRVGESATMLVGSARIPAWHWVRIGTTQRGQNVPITFENVSGAPALGAILVVPHDDLERRAAFLAHALAGRIINLPDLHSLNEWPEAISGGPITNPEAKVKAQSSVFMDEDYDGFWRLDGSSARPTPGWLFATAFAPVKGSISPTYMPQDQLEFWWRIESFALAGIGIAAGLSRILRRRQLSSVARAKRG